jgi:hypothetical protein
MEEYPPEPRYMLLSICCAETGTVQQLTLKNETIQAESRQNATIANKQVSVFKHGRQKGGIEKIPWRDKNRWKGDIRKWATPAPAVVAGTRARHEPRTVDLATNQTQAREILGLFIRAARDLFRILSAVTAGRARLFTIAVRREREAKGHNCQGHGEDECCCLHQEAPHSRHIT